MTRDGPINDSFDEDSFGELVHISNSLFFPGGALVALVAISSCANHVTYWAAFLIGCLAGKKLYIFS